MFTFSFGTFFFIVRQNVFCLFRVATSYITLTMPKNEDILIWVEEFSLFFRLRRQMNSGFFRNLQRRWMLFDVDNIAYAMHINVVQYSLVFRAYKFPFYRSHLSPYSWWQQIQARARGKWQRKEMEKKEKKIHISNFRSGLVLTTTTTTTEKSMISKSAKHERLPSGYPIWSQRERNLRNGWHALERQAEKEKESTTENSYENVLCVCHSTMPLTNCFAIHVRGLLKLFSPFSSCHPSVTSHPPPFRGKVYIEIYDYLLTFVRPSVFPSSRISDSYLSENTHYIILSSYFHAVVRCSRVR